jgi:hypothetical protein
LELADASDSPNLQKETNPINGEAYLAKSELHTLPESEQKTILSILIEQVAHHFLKYLEERICSRAAFSWAFSAQCTLHKSTEIQPI